MRIILLSMLGILSVVPAFARDFIYMYEDRPLIYTVVNENEKICEVGCQKDLANIIKADNDNNWKEVVKNRFKTLIIPEQAIDVSGADSIAYTVIGISPKCFMGSFYEMDLSAVEIPNTVKSIGSRAFEHCDLTSITIPNSVHSIGPGAFSWCSLLSSIEIPNTITKIEDRVFSGSALTSVKIPHSVKKIGDGAFQSCEFASIEIPNSVTSICDNAFAGCGELLSINIPNSVTNIGDCAFVGCTHLTTVSIPNSVRRIGNGVFSDCISLNSIVIPNSVVSIGNAAFSACFNLKSVVIPESVNNIGVRCFGDSWAIETIKVEAAKPPIMLEAIDVDNSYSCFADEVYQNATLLVPEESKSAYESHKVWGRFKHIKTFTSDFEDGSAAININDADRQSL